MGKRLYRQVRQTLLCWDMLSDYWRPESLFQNVQWRRNFAHEGTVHAHRNSLVRHARLTRKSYPTGDYFQGIQRDVAMQARICAGRRDIKSSQDKPYTDSADATPHKSTTEHQSHECFNTGRRARSGTEIRNPLLDLYQEMSGIAI